MAGGERSIRIRFDGSAAGLTSAAAKARAELRAVQKQAEENRKNLARFASGAVRAAGSLAKFAVKLASLGSGLGLVMSLAGAMAALSGAAGLLPAAAFAAAGAMAAVKLGADGAKRAFQALKPTIDGLKSSVSAAFEKSLTPAVNNLKAVLPALSGGLSGIATQMGIAATSFTAMLNTSAGTKQLQDILAGTATIIHNIGAALAPLGAAFLRIGQVAMPMLSNLTGGIGAAANRFNTFIQQAAASGQLQAWIQRGINAFHQLGAILGDIGGIVGDVFGALSNAGIGLGGTLGMVIHQIRTFLDSAQGQAVLNALASAIATVSAAVGQALHAALLAIGPALPPLLTAFSQLVATLTPAFVGIITVLGTALQGVAIFIQQNTSWLIPLVATLGSLALVIRGIIAAVRIWRTVVIAYTVVQWLLNAAMSANPIGIVIAAVVALIGLVVLIIAKWKPISAFFVGLWNTVSAAFTAAIDWVVARFSDAWNWITGVWSGITAFFSGLWNGVVSGVSAVVGWVVGAWNGAVNGIRGFFSGLGSFVGGIWDGIVGGVKSAINGAIWAINKIIGGVNAVTGAVGIPAIPSIPYLAKGGTAHAGRSYVVGENGPELFTPGVTGRVTSNAQLGGAQTTVKVYIGDQELRDLVRVEIDEDNRETSDRVLAGVGALR